MMKTAIRNIARIMESLGFIVTIVVGLEDVE